jgi:hypothetical protein
VGSQYGATTEAAESLIAQLHSQSKLATPRPEKFDTKTKLKKQKNMLPKGSSLRSID